MSGSKTAANAITLAGAIRSGVIGAAMNATPVGRAVFALEATGDEVQQRHAERRRASLRRPTPGYPACHAMAML